MNELAKSETYSNAIDLVTMIRVAGLAGRTCHCVFLQQHVTPLNTSSEGSYVHWSVPAQNHSINPTKWPRKIPSPNYSPTVYHGSDDGWSCWQSGYQTHCPWKIQNTGKQRCGQATLCGYTRTLTDRKLKPTLYRIETMSKVQDEYPTIAIKWKIRAQLPKNSCKGTTALQFAKLQSSDTVGGCTFYGTSFLANVIPQPSIMKWTIEPCLDQNDQNPIAN